MQQEHKLEGALRASTGGDDTNLADIISTFGDHIHNAYGEGGGFYSLSVGIGIVALRETNPYTAVPGIAPEDWDNTMHRAEGLRSKPNLKTVEAISGTALLEIAQVNDGYVDGYQRAFSIPNLSYYLGFTGLGAMHAHDLMHFASVRQ